MRFKRKKPSFFKICNTARGNFASHLFPCEAKQSLDCEQFLYQNFLILGRFLFFFSPIAISPIHDLLNWSESHDLMNRNNREAIIIANVTKINEPILKAKRMGWVNDATIEKRLALAQLTVYFIRSFLFWQSDFTTYLNSNPLPVTPPIHNWSTVAGFKVILTSVSTKLRTTMRLTRNESPFRRYVMMALIITTFKHRRGSKERNLLFLAKLMG